MLGDRSIVARYNAKRGMILVFIAIILSSTIFFAIQMSWIADIPFLFETVSSDNFTSKPIITNEYANSHQYTAIFIHQGITDISKSNLSVSVTIIHNSELNQFELSLNQEQAQYGSYTIQLEGFFTQDSVERVDTGSVSINTENEISNITVCLRYGTQILSCSGQSQLS